MSLKTGYLGKNCLRGSWRNKLPSWGWTRRTRFRQGTTSGCRICGLLCSRACQCCLPVHGHSIEFDDRPVLPVSHHGGLNYLPEGGLLGRRDEQRPELVDRVTRLRRVDFVNSLWGNKYLYYLRVELDITIKPEWMLQYRIVISWALAFSE